MNTFERNWTIKVIRSRSAEIYCKKSTRYSLNCTMVSPVATEILRSFHTKPVGPDVPEVVLTRSSYFGGLATGKYVSGSGLRTLLNWNLANDAKPFREIAEE